MLWVHGGAQLANSLAKGHEPWQLRTYFNGGHRWKLVYYDKCQGTREGKTAGIHPFADTPTGIVVSSGPTEEPDAGAATHDFPAYEPISGEDSDEDNMLSLEDPYPCRFRPKASLSMKT